MIDRDTLRAFIARHAEMSFSRSGGKGGQNVNKLNTKVLAVIDLNSLDLLTASDKEHVRTKLKNRLTRDGRLYLQVQDERTQARNQELALDRLADLIVAATRVKRKRKKTRVPAGVREKRLEKKKKQTNKKRLRQSPGGAE
jgi:ribosome-associated protein